MAQPAKTRVLTGGLVVFACLFLLGAQCTKKAPETEAAAGKGEVKAAKPEKKAKPPKAPRGPAVIGVSLEDNKVIIKGSVFLEGYPARLEDPLRIVVDVSNASLAPEVPAELSGSGLVSRVIVKSLSELDIPVVRVVVYVNQDVLYKLEEKGNDLILELTPSEKTKEEAETEQEKSFGLLPYEETKKELERLLTGAPPPPITTPLPVTVTGVSGGPAPEGKQPAKLPPLLPALPPPNPDGSATVVGEVFYRTSDDGIQILIQTNGQVKDFLDFDILSPPKLVLDFWGLSAASKRKVYPIAWAGVRQVRIGKHGDKTRVVIDFKGKVPAYDVRRTGSGVAVTIFKGYPYFPGGVNVRTYKTQPGEDLRSIAQKFYGNPEDWPRLLAANREIFTRAEREEIRRNNGFGELGAAINLRIPVR